MAYLKWTDVEKTLLLNFVIAKIEKGNSIKSACEEFADVYGISASAVKSAWQGVAVRNKLAIQIAKNNWKLVEKPKKDEQEKIRKHAEKIAEKNRKHRKKLIMESRKMKAKKEKRFINTEMKPKAHSGVKYILDENGVVVSVMA